MALQGDSLFGKVAEEKLAYFVQAFCEGYWMAGHEFRDLKKPDPDIFYPQALELAGLKTRRFNANGQEGRNSREGGPFCPMPWGSSRKRVNSDGVWKALSENGQGNGG